jgi:DNA-binding CsgD family transcriptional regulator
MLRCLIMMVERAETVRRAEHLADIFSSLRALGLADRGLFNEILQRVLDANPRLLGVWTVWEPDALDGKDAIFAGALGHDQTGRFIPFWHRAGGGMHLQPNTDYDLPSADWYLVPSRSGRQSVIDPYEYVVGGKKLFIASQVAPIIGDGRCLGVVGVDIHMDSLLGAGPNFADAVLDRGHVVLDADGKVRHVSDATRRLIAHYAGGGKKDLPETLHQAIRRKLAAAEVRRHTWRFFKGNRRLVVRLIRHPHTACCFLLVEEQETGSSPAWELSPREVEVADWMRRGKSNEEIAIILGISSHTVKNHLERIFRKLGVENRHAAAATLHAASSELKAA